MARSFFLVPLLVACALTGCKRAPAPLTTDRISQDRMEAMVARPMARVHRGDMAGAEADVATLIAQARVRHGGHSVEEFDLLTAFAVGLVGAERPELAASYMRRAGNVARRVFGPRHPETAVAAHSEADIIDPLSTAPPPPEAVALMEEALSIRREMLGPRNVETLATVSAMARMKVRLLVAGGDRTAAAPAEALILELLPAAEAGGEDFERHLPPPAMLRHDLGRIYAATGRAADLVRLIEQEDRESARPPSAGWRSLIDLLRRKSSDLVQRQKPGAPRGSGCIMFLDMMWGEEIALLEKNGYPRAAEAIRSRECSMTRSGG